MKFRLPHFWQPMAEVKLFTWGYLGFHVFFMVSMRFFLNYNEVIEHWLFWVGIVISEHALIFSYLGLSKKFIRRFSNRFVIFSALLIGAIRTVLTTSAQHVVIPGTNQVPWVYQLLTGALFELLIVTLWANVNGAYRKYSQLGRELRQIKSSILGYRENAAELLADERDSLVRTTKESLMPQISSIERALSAQAGAIAAAEVAGELKKFLNNQLRPLTESLNTAANRLVMPTAADKSAFWSIVSLPKKSRLSNSIYPGTSFVIMLLSYVTAPLWLLNSDWVPINALLSTSFFLVLLGVKSLTTKWPPINSFFVASSLVITALLAIAPTVIVIVLSHPDSQQALVLSGTLIWCSVILLLMLAYLDSLDYQAKNFLNELQAENKSLAHEMSLFEQQLWAGRRSWSMVLHGTVQAALTAALSRLNAPKVEAEAIQLAKQDLQRAINSLNAPAQAQVDLVGSIRDLQETWQGVCDVDVQVDQTQLELIAADNRSSMCVNEILKEAVSNAVRHGDASQVRIQIALEQGEINLRIWNSGLTPGQSGRKGLGSTMLDELTISWSLGVDASTAETLLAARLPFSLLADR